MSGLAQQSGSCIIFSALTDCFVTHEWPVCRYREGPALPIRCTFQGTLRDLVTSLKPRQPRKIYYQQVMAILIDVVLLRDHDQQTIESTWPADYWEYMTSRLLRVHDQQTIESTWPADYWEYMTSWLLRVHDQLTIDAVSKVASLMIFVSLLIRHTYVSHCMDIMYLWTSVHRSWSREPRLKSCAAVSNHGQVCSFYIAPAHSAVWMSNWP